MECWVCAEFVDAAERQREVFPEISDTAHHGGEMIVPTVQTFDVKSCGFDDNGSYSVSACIRRSYFVC